MPVEMTLDEVRGNDPMEVVELRPALMALDAEATEEAVGTEGVAEPLTTTEPVLMVEKVIKSAESKGLKVIPINYKILVMIASTIGKASATVPVKVIEKVTKRLLWHFQLFLVKSLTQEVQ